MAPPNLDFSYRGLDRNPSMEWIRRPTACNASSRRCNPVEPRCPHLGHPRGCLCRDRNLLGPTDHCEHILPWFTDRFTQWLWRDSQFWCPCPQAPQWPRGAQLATLDTAVVLMDEASTWTTILSWLLFWEDKEQQVWEINGTKHRYLGFGVDCPWVFVFGVPSLLSQCNTAKAFRESVKKMAGRSLLYSSSGSSPTGD
jgi:hypothetical protein